MPRIPAHTRIGAKSLALFIASYTILYSINDKLFDAGRLLYYIYIAWALIMGVYIVILFIIGVYNLIKD